MPADPGSPAGCRQPRLLVWRNGRLGNTIVAIPLILALRRAFPRSHLAVVVDPAGRDLLSAYGEIDDLIVYQRTHGNWGLGASVELLRRLRARRFTHSLHLKRFFRNALLARAAGIPERLGFETGGRAPLLTGTVPYREDRNIVLTCLSLLPLLGQPEPADPRYRYPVNDADADVAADLIARCGAAGRPYALVHCGAITQSAHRLTPGAVRAIAGHIASRLSLLPVLLMGPSDEDAVAEVRAAFDDGGPAVFDARRHSVRVTIEAVRRAHLFAGQDSGPAHLAALAGTPEVVFYAERPDLASHLIKWTPWQERCVPCVLPSAAGNDQALDAFARAIDRLRPGTPGPAAGSG